MPAHDLTTPPKTEAEPPIPNVAERAERRSAEPPARQEAPPLPLPGFAGGWSAGGSDAHAATVATLRRVTAERSGLAPHLLLQLQGRHGNRYVQRLIGPQIQRAPGAFGDNTPVVISAATFEDAASAFAQ